MEAWLVRRTIAEYADALPRARAEAQQVGPFEVFVPREGSRRRFAARPQLGQRGASAAEVRALGELLVTSGLAPALHWVHEVSPALRDAATEAGAHVVSRPLMVLASPRGDRHTPDPDLLTTVLTARHPAKDEVLGTITAAFSGAEHATPGDPTGLTESFADGLRLVGAFRGGPQAPRSVGGGVHQPVGLTTQLSDIGVLVSERGRGTGARITLHLMADALAAGMRTVWLIATDDAVARVYERVGFERVGTACEVVWR